MKKNLIIAVFLAFGAMNLQAQNLYVRLIGAEQPVAFSLAARPTITFDHSAQAKQVGTATHQLSDIQYFAFTNRSATDIMVRLEDDNRIAVFPNPVNYELNIVLDNFTPGFVFRIFDMAGRLLLTNRLYSATTQIQMQNFRSGTYVLNIEFNGQHVQSFTIVKQ